MPRSSRVLSLLTVLLAEFLLPSIASAAEPPVSHPAWAAKISRPGLPNLHKVNDGLYRGAQPTPDGIQELQKLGVKTIVDLRFGHSDKEILGDANIAFEHIPMLAWAPKEDDVVRFLRIVTDKSRQPVFVHCQHGADRTGMMCAAYRVVVDGWTKQQAIDEMTNGDFGFHAIWTALPKFIENLDVEKVKAKAGLKK
jgi:protein tyrosine phosphatase (PTP) superfamily phosphohydrolase (DUF442 family)